jgi:hypothetical protein
MKTAVIVVGTHYAGKSKTITKYLKPMLGMSPRKRKFTLDETHGLVKSQSKEEVLGQNGIIYSQSFEENGKDKYLAKIIREYSVYDLLVLAARPSDEPVSCLKPLKAKLEDEGFRVKLVHIEKGHSEPYYKEKAKEIFAILTGSKSRKAKA